MHKKLIALVIIVIIFLVSASATFFLFFSQPKVKIVDQSEEYTIEYKDNEFFNENLNKWKVWRKEGIFLEADGKSHTINNIVIFATDEVQPYHTFHSEGIKKGVLLFSTDESINKNGTLELKVYINPESVKNLTEEQLSEQFLFISLARFADMSLPSTYDDEEKFKEFAARYEEYKAVPSRIPFVISKP